MADATAGLPDIQGLLGNVLGQTQSNMQETQSGMSALQDYIRNQQKDQLNIPALQFAAGLLKPTRTGSFAESVGNAGEGALGALQKQREIDLGRQAKILELTQAKGQLLAQQAQMLMPYAQMQMGDQAFNSAFGGQGSASSSGTGGSGAPGSSPGGSPGPIPAGISPVTRYQSLLRFGMITKNPEALSAAKLMLENDPGLKKALAQGEAEGKGAGELSYAGKIAGAKTGAEESAKAPYELVEKTLPDGSKVKVPKSTITGGGGMPAPVSAPTALPPAVAAPSVAAPGTAPAGGAQTELPASNRTGLEMASTEAKKVPDAIMSLEQQDQRMQAIDEVMQRYETGAFAEPKADALAALRAAGINVKDTDTASPAALQEFRKNSIGEVFDKLKEFGGQVRVAEITGLGKVVTDPDLQPAANQAISAQIRGVIDWRKQMLNEYGKDYEAGNITKPATWYADWVKAHPLGQYVTQRLALTPVAGVAPDQVPKGGLGIAPRDVMGPNGQVVLSKGEKYIRVDKNKYLPLNQYADYLAGNKGQ